MCHVGVTAAPLSSACLPATTRPSLPQGGRSLRLPVSGRGTGASYVGLEGSGEAPSQLGRVRAEEADSCLRAPG